MSWLSPMKALLVLVSFALPAPQLFAQEPEIFSLEDYEANSRRGADRDAFQVLDNPKLVDVAAADEELSPDEPVIGLRVGKFAQAYPISVMGGIELVNDTIGELPVTVSW